MMIDLAWIDEALAIYGQIRKSGARPVRCRLTASQTDDLARETGQTQFLLGVPVTTDSVAERASEAPHASTTIPRPPGTGGQRTWLSRPAGT